jgi:DNA-binding response OmpR family regulator
LNILIVEDEKRLSDALVQILKEQKNSVDAVYNGTDGLYYALNANYDVMILDIMLPKIDGFTVVKRMRENHNATPVLLLTAKYDIADKVKGLDCGADDYLTKPFSSAELLARIRALSRRRGDVILEILAFSDIKLNTSTNTLSCHNREIHLGHKELEIMKILMRNLGVITTKEVLINKVWGHDSNADDNNVEVYISFLRKKLTFLKSTTTIDTVRKYGYKFGHKNDK